MEELKGFFHSSAFYNTLGGAEVDTDEPACEYHAGAPAAELVKYDATKPFPQELMCRLAQ